jgi:hypothetical protein
MLLQTASNVIPASLLKETIGVARNNIELCEVRLFWLIAFGWQWKAGVRGSLRKEEEKGSSSRGSGNLRYGEADRSCPSQEASSSC